jgi:hypothetical protein
MQCIAYFDGARCTNKVDGKNWCSEHAKILLNFRKKHKNIETKIYPNNSEIRFSELGKKTALEIQKFYHILQKAIYYRNMVTTLGFCPEERDYGHDFRIYLMERDLEKVEAILSKKYRSEAASNEDRGKDIENDDLCENKIKTFIRSVPKEKTKKTNKSEEKEIDFEKFGKKSWNEKQIALFILRFCRYSFGETLKKYCAKKFGEYGTRFYWYMYNYIGNVAMLCCPNYVEKGTAETNMRIDELEDWEAKEKRASGYILTVYLQMYANILRFDKDADLPPYVVSVTNKKKTIYVPLDLCLKAALNETIEIRVKSELNRETMEMKSVIGGYDFSTKVDYCCNCNGTIVTNIVMSKTDLQKDFPTIDETYLTVRDEIKKVLTAVEFHII